MSKKNFISLMIGTIGTVLFALGMCMTMIEEWNAFNQGIIIGVIMMIPFLFCVIQPYFIYRRTIRKKQKELQPVIDRKKEEIRTICERGSALI